MGNSASSLPYSIGKQVAVVDNGWTLHEGQRKSDGSAVSVFVAKKPALVKTPASSSSSSPNFTQLEPARHHYAYSKKLRHPHILSVHATLDTDNPAESGASGAEFASKGGGGGATQQTGDLIIVTEPCVSLNTWLQTHPPAEQVAWGLEAAVRALHFLHASANIAHGNVSPSSFFVTRSGDVKLWNFSLATNIATASGGISQHFKDYEQLICPAEYRSPERIERRWQDIAANGTHAMDSYSVGILMRYFYGGHIPGPLTKAAQRMQTPNLKMRPRLQPLLKCPVFDTPLQKWQLQLEEFTVQPVEAKVQFWTNLTPSLKAGLIPEPLAVYKILPLIKTTMETICSSDSIRSQDMYRREVLSMLAPMFYVAETFLQDEEFAKELSPVIAMLFTVNDRGIRGTLLKKATVMVEKLNKQTLNSSVFEPLCSGFSDSSAALRELTLKATLVLVPHLTHPNLEKLSRYLVRLQGDQEPAIRTNTVLFFSRLAPYLTEMSRQKLLLPAFCRAMKDPFTPCRLAALQATLKAKEYFNPAGIAGKVLPAVTPCLIDPAPDVRKEAFSAVEDLMFVLRQESERLAHLPVEGGGGGAAAGATAGGAPTAVAAAPASAPAKATVPAAPTSGGYFSSWISSSSKSSAPAPAAPPPAAVPPSSYGAPTTAMASMSMQQQQPAVADDGWDDEDDDGWGDDDLDDIGGGTSAAQQPATTSGSLFTTAPTPATDDDDDLFGGFDSKPARPASMSATRKTSGGSGSRLMVPGAGKTTTKKTSTPKLAVQKLSVDDDVADGWDDF